MGEHPHRGFETVTLVYEGKLAHRDSGAHAGVIGPGDVQWMTAASGIVHEEIHEREFACNGGTLQAIQLWVNLPRAFEMSAPRYQTIQDTDIPAIDLDKGGRLRVIAGLFRGRQGPAGTFTAVDLYDVQLEAGAHVLLPFPEWHNASLFVLRGGSAVNGWHEAGERRLQTERFAGDERCTGAQPDSSQGRRADRRTGRPPRSLRHEHP